MSDPQKLRTKNLGISRRGFITDSAAVLAVLPCLKTAISAAEKPRPDSTRADDSPSYPQPVFDVFESGARGDKTTDDTAALQAAIDACAGTGGTVYVHDGVFLTGMLTLGSDMTFYVDDSATVLGAPYSDDYKRYYPDLPMEYETRTHQYVQRALIYAKERKNLRLAGKGTIDLNAQTWREIFYESKLHESQRPLTLVFHRCSNLTVCDLRLRNSAMWCSAYDQCEHLRIENLEIYSDVLANNDGIDILDCRDVQILNNKIWTDDDAICLKSTCAVGLSDILIQGNVVYSARANGIKMGTDSSGPVERVKIYDNLVFFSRLAGLAWESVDGSHTRDLHVRNLEIHQSEAPVFFVVGERGRGGFPPGSIQDVVVENVRAYESRQTWGMMIMGLPKPGSEIRNITIRNCYFEMDGTQKKRVKDPPEIADRYPECNMFKTLPAYGFFVRNVDGIRFENVQIGYLHSDLRPWLITRGVKNLTQERITETGKYPPKTFQSPLWKTPFRMSV